MKFTFRLPFSGPKQPINNTPPLAAPKEPVSPLDLPEILELIFCFLDQYSLQVSASPVCKQWNLISQRWIQRQLVWDSASKVRSLRWLTTAIGTLDIHTVVFYAGFIKSRDQKRNRAAFLSGLEQRNKGWTIRNSFGFSTGKEKVSGLCGIELWGWEESDDLLMRVVPLVKSTLTSLRLRNCSWTTMELEVLLLGCPHLGKLHLETSDSYGRMTYSPPPVQPIQDLGWVPFFSSWKLYSLVLINAAIRQLDLESLLRDCPDLEELKIVGLRTRVRIYHQTEYYEAFNRRMFIQGLVQMGFVPRLRSFHFSMQDAHWDSAADMELLMDGLVNSAMQLSESICSTSPASSTSNQRLIEWGFLVPEFRRSGPVDAGLKKCLEMVPNTVTCLDLVAHPDFGTRFPFLEVLHQFLCKSPLLVHLRARQTLLDIDWLDVNHPKHNLQTAPAPLYRSLGRVNSVQTQRQADVWVCRGLKTLKITLGSQYGVLEGCAWDTEKGRDASRIVFGYLARCCPRLENVQLMFQDEVSSLDLASGFCLLSRLNSLKTLAVVVKDDRYRNKGVSPKTLVESWQLDWMGASANGQCEGGSDKKNKKKKKKMAMNKHYRRQVQKTIKNWNIPQAQAGYSADATEGQELYPWSELGCLVDVKKQLLHMLDSKNSNGSGEFECWPHLTSLSVLFGEGYRGNENVLEKVVKRIRPLPPSRWPTRATYDWIGLQHSWVTHL